MNQTDLDHRLARVRGPLVVPAVPPVPTEPRASAHFLVDGKRVYGIRQKPKKGSDLRRQYEATVGKSGKHCASRAVPQSPGKPSDSPLFVEWLSPGLTHQVRKLLWDKMLQFSVRGDTIPKFLPVKDLQIRCVCPGALPKFFD